MLMSAQSDQRILHANFTLLRQVKPVRVRVWACVSAFVCVCPLNKDFMKGLQAF